MTGSKFYATKEDLIEIFNYIYNNTDCIIMEAYSRFDKELRSFANTEQILKTFNIGICESKNFELELQLYSKATRGKLFIKKITLDQAKSGHKFRYSSEGWGLIQFYCGGVFEKDKLIIASHIGYNSEKRALLWASTYPELESPENWDWTMLKAVTRKISTFINRDLTVKKEDKKNILKDAHSLHMNGYKLYSMEA